MNGPDRTQLLRKRVIEPWYSQAGFERLRSGASRVVPGMGNLYADIAIVGEAPGEQEDLEGKPFVGPAGVLLTQMLVDVKVNRSLCWVTNLVKFRPTKDGQNRQPTYNERALAHRYLKRELDIIRPRVVVLCGGIALNAIKEGAITRERGRAFTIKGRIYLPIRHPAACLRDPDIHRVTRRDLAVLPELLTVPGSPAEVVQVGGVPD